MRRGGRAEVDSLGFAVGDVASRALRRLELGEFGAFERVNIHAPASKISKGVKKARKGSRRQPLTTLCLCKAVKCLCHSPPSR